MTSNQTVVESAGLTDVGRKRKHNEDAFYVSDRHGIYIVADGMGGHMAGEVASRIVVETIQDQMGAPATDGEGMDMITRAEKASNDSARLLSTIHLANRMVHTLASKKAEFKGMGSTVATVMLSGTKNIAVNVGDSPIYLIRNNSIEPLFVPHTYMAEHAAMGSAGAKPLGEEYRHMITRAVGVKSEVQPDISEIQGLEGDIVLLCSDGLSDLVNERELLAVVTKFPPKKAVKALVHLANKRGGDDNITVIILRLDKHPNRLLSKTSGTALAPTDRLAAIHGIPVDIDTEKATLPAHIKRISPGGGFIETTDPFTAGEEITMTFADPSGEGFFTVDGHVSGRDPMGIEIAFNPLTEEQRVKLKRLIGH